MIGTRLGPWVLERELGRGGMGCVYLVRLAQAIPETKGTLPERAAVKVLAPELAQAEGFLLRFQREIDVLRQLDHPNIVRFFGSGEQDGHFYFAMEYIDGSSYQTLLEERGRISWEEVLEVALEVTLGLKHAHNRGIIHRDLKPSNILRGFAYSPSLSGNASTSGERETGRPSLTSLSGPASANGQPAVIKLTDFGIASLFAGRNLTVTGSVVGTAEFLSPEQAAGKPATKRSDLYSLGVLLYTLITGRTPFQGEPVALLHKHQFARFDPPRAYCESLPHDLDDLICQLLAKNPADRPDDSGSLHRQLDRIRRKLERKAAHSGVLSGRRHGGGPQDPLGSRERTAEEDKDDAAALMSQLMREELRRDIEGGPIKRFLNKPWVIISLFVLTLSVIVWTFWPAGPGTLYRRGANLMESEHVSDWETAWSDYFTPLEQRYPDHPYKEQLEQFREQLQQGKAERKAAQLARQAGPMTEAQWFYQQGLRARQQGDEVRARRIWKALVTAFKEVPTEGPWVRLARQRLKEKTEAEVPRDWEPVQESVDKARALRKAGKKEQASQILDALRELYKGDARVRKILPQEGGA